MRYSISVSSFTVTANTVKTWSIKVPHKTKSGYISLVANNVLQNAEISTEQPPSGATPFYSNSVLEKIDSNTGASSTGLNYLTTYWKCDGLNSNLRVLVKANAGADSTVSWVITFFS